jgi:hypothetical protein
VRDPGASTNAPRTLRNEGLTGPKRVFFFGNSTLKGTGSVVLLIEEDQRVGYLSGYFIFKSSH